MKIIHSNRKTIAIIIDRKGEVIVRAPKYVTKKRIMEFVEQKQDWINKKCSQINDTGELSLREGARLMFPETPISKEKLLIWAKKEAKKVLTQRVEHYVNNVVILPKGMTYSAVKVTSAKTRWGSCSGKNSLNFTWKLSLAPMYVIDYVVVHELCHIVHKNHGQNFWRMVNEILPDYKKAKDWLQQNRRLLEFF